MKNSQLLEALSNCINHCNHCADACLDEPDVKKMVTCIRLDRICAAVCKATADVLSINSSTDVRSLVKACEELCNKCAEECEKHEAQHCKDCAQACKKCAEACAAY